MVADSDCEVFGDEWDLAMGLDNADGRESNNDIDSSGEVDDLLEAEEA